MPHVPVYLSKHFIIYTPNTKSCSQEASFHASTITKFKVMNEPSSQDGDQGHNTVKLAYKMSHPPSLNQ